MEMSCAFCQKRFAPHSLFTHQATCDSRLIPCNLCGKLVQIRDMALHMKEHPSGNSEPSSPVRSRPVSASPRSPLASRPASRTGSRPNSGAATRPHSASSRAGSAERCRQSTDSAMEMVACSTCGKMMQSDVFDEHRPICPGRTVQCHICSAHVSFCDLASHTESQHGESGTGRSKSSDRFRHVSRPTSASSNPLSRPSSAQVGRPASARSRPMTPQGDPMLLEEVSALRSEVARLREKETQLLQQEAIHTQSEEITLLHSKLEELRAEAAGAREAKNEAEALREELATLRATGAATDVGEELIALKEKYNETLSRKEELEASLAKNQVDGMKRVETVALQEAELGSLRETLAVKDGEIVKLKQDVAVKDKEIERLKAKEVESGSEVSRLAELAYTTGKVIEPPLKMLEKVDNLEKEVTRLNDVLEQEKKKGEKLLEAATVHVSEAVRAALNILDPAKTDLDLPPVTNAQQTWEAWKGQHQGLSSDGAEIGELWKYWLPLLVEVNETAVEGIEGVKTRPPSASATTREELTEMGVEDLRKQLEAAKSAADVARRNQEWATERMKGLYEILEQWTSLVKHNPQLSGALGSIEQALAQRRVSVVEMGTRPPSGAGTLPSALSAMGTPRSRASGKGDGGSAAAQTARSDASTATALSSLGSLGERMGDVSDADSETDDEDLMAAADDGLEGSKPAPSGKGDENAKDKEKDGEPEAPAAPERKLSTSSFNSEKFREELASVKVENSLVEVRSLALDSDEPTDVWVEKLVESYQPYTVAELIADHSRYVDVCNALMHFIAAQRDTICAGLPWATQEAVTEEAAQLGLPPKGAEREGFLWLAEDCAMFPLSDVWDRDESGRYYNEVTGEVYDEKPLRKAYRGLLNSLMQASERFSKIKGKLTLARSSSRNPITWSKRPDTDNECQTDIDLITFEELNERLEQAEKAHEESKKKAQMHVAGDKHDFVDAVRNRKTEQVDEARAYLSLLGEKLATLSSVAYPAYSPSMIALRRKTKAKAKKDVRVFKPSEYRRLAMEANSAVQAESAKLNAEMQESFRRVLTPTTSELLDRQAGMRPHTAEPEAPTFPAAMLQHRPGTSPGLAAPALIPRAQTAPPHHPLQSTSASTLGSTGSRSRRKKGDYRSQFFRKHWVEDPWNDDVMSQRPPPAKSPPRRHLDPVYTNDVENVIPSIVPVHSSPSFDDDALERKMVKEAMAGLHAAHGPFPSKPRIHAQSPGHISITAFPDKQRRTLAYLPPVR
eukprot:Rmarinus@m.4641